MTITAAAALSAVIMAPAAHANEPGTFVALALSPTAWAYGLATAATEDRAIEYAFAECAAFRARDCSIAQVNDSTVDPACLTLVESLDHRTWIHGEGADRSAAELAVQSQLPPGSRIVETACATTPDELPDAEEEAPDAEQATAGQATVLSDVDVYDVADGEGTPYPGVFLNAGDSYQLVEPCRDSWCHLYIPELDEGTGWVYQDGFLEVS